MSLYLTWVCRGVVVVVFTVSVLGKVRDRAAFAEFTAAARVLSGLSGRWPGRLAVLVVAAEAAVVLGMARRGTAPAAFAAATVLLGVFTVALVRHARSGAALACRCLGGSTAAGYRPVVRNALLIVVSVGGLCCSTPYLAATF